MKSPPPFRGGGSYWGNSDPLVSLNRHCRFHFTRGYSPAPRRGAKYETYYHQTPSLTNVSQSCSTSSGVGRKMRICRFCSSLMNPMRSMPHNVAAGQRSSFWASYSRHANSISASPADKPASCSRSSGLNKGRSLAFSPASVVARHPLYYTHLSSPAKRLITRQRCLSSVLATHVQPPAATAVSPPG